MRLIDADKINYMWQHYRDGEFSDGVTLQSVIKRMPTIEIVEAKENISAEWVMAIDDFEDGRGHVETPHCTNCSRGVYRHDAGSYCPFCGAVMRNPMRL